MYLRQNALIFVRSKRGKDLVDQLASDFQVGNNMQARVEKRSEVLGGVFTCGNGRVKGNGRLHFMNNTGEVSQRGNDPVDNPGEYPETVVGQHERDRGVVACLGVEVHFGDFI